MQVPSSTNRPVHTDQQCFVWNNNEIKSVDLKDGGQLRINFPRRSTTSSWDGGEIEGGSWPRCLCYVPLPVSVRQRRSRLSQRKVWRNSRRKRRKLQRRLRNRPNWSVGCFFVSFFLIHIRRPLLTAVRASTCRAVGHCESRRCPYPQCGRDYPLFKYSCQLGFVYIHPNKALFSFTRPHNMLLQTTEHV